MGAWKDARSSATIAKGGKKASQLKIGGMAHKNKDVAKAVERAKWA